MVRVGSEPLELRVGSSFGLIVGIRSIGRSGTPLQDNVWHNLSARDFTFLTNDF